MSGAFIIQTMPILLTEQQWADVKQETDIPARVQDPTRSATFVLLRAEVYDRFRSLFEEDPITDEERLNHLQQFGRRAGWDDPAMDIYDDLDPRRAP
jgi:hypothetical protein